MISLERLRIIKVCFFTTILISVIVLFVLMNLSSFNSEERRIISVTKTVLSDNYNISIRPNQLKSEDRYQGVGIGMGEQRSNLVTYERRFVPEGQGYIPTQPHAFFTRKMFTMQGWTRLEDYIQIGPRMMYKNNSWSRGVQTTDISACVDLCRDKSAATLYKATTKSCLCEDYFSLAHPSLANPSVHDVTQIAVNNNLTGLLAQRLPGCNCTDTPCDAVSCRNVSCWVGPSVSDLSRFARFKSGFCEGERVFTVRSYLRYSDLETSSRIAYQTVKELQQSGMKINQSVHGLTSFCIPESELRGFWPLNTHICPAYRKSGSTRIYTLSSPNNMPVPIRLKPTEDQIKILIAAHWRSGSTLTSELFATHPDSMYIFEPLQYVQGNRYFNNSTDHDRITTRALYDIFNCNLHTLPSTTFNKFPQATLMRRECDVKRIPFLDCLASVTTRCAHAKMLAVKTIRAKMSVLKAIGTRMPNIKGLVVLRDPRAIHSSRMHFMNASYNRRLKDVSDICKDQTEDVITYKQLSSKYKGQLSVIHYEDLIFNTTASAHRIYRELSLGEPPKSIVRSLYQLTHGSHTKTKINSKLSANFTTFRKDSIKAAFKWKKELEFSFIQEVDRLCAESYRYTGYRPVTSLDDLNNMTNYHRVSSLSGIHS